VAEVIAQLGDLGVLVDVWPLQGAHQSEPRASASGLLAPAFAAGPRQPTR
jgi:hypothetical protein